MSTPDRREPRAKLSRRSRANRTVVTLIMFAFALADTVTWGAFSALAMVFACVVWTWLLLTAFGFFLDEYWPVRRRHWR